MNLTEGMKSSEFIITLVTLVLVALAPKLGMTTEQMWGVIAASGLYGAGRSLTKSGAPK